MDTDDSSSTPPQVEVDGVFISSKQLRALKSVPGGWSMNKAENGGGGGGEEYMLYWRAHRGEQNVAW